MIICQHILLADIWSLQGSYALAGVTDDGFR